MEENDLSLNKDVEIQKESLDMNNLALSNVTKYLATYNNPKDWILDEKEAKTAQILKSVQPDKSSIVGSLGYATGEFLRTTYAAPRQFLGAVDLIKSAVHDRFYPNADTSALERWADNYGKMEAQREKTSEEFIAQEVGHPDWYGFASGALGLVRDIAFTGGFAKLGAKAGAKIAGKKLAGRVVGEEVASRYLGMAAAKGAEKAGTAAITGSVFAQELGSGTVQDINEYISQTGDIDLKYYDPSVDLAVNIGVGGLSAWIEKGLGVERFVPRLFARGAGEKIPSIIQILARGAEGFVGESLEEGAQDITGQVGDMIKGYRDWWDFDFDQILTSMTVGGVLGGIAGSGLYYINRRTAINRLVNEGMNKDVAADLVDMVASNEINKTINNLSATNELKTRNGQAYEKIKASIKNALELQGWNEKMIDQKTGQPLNIDQYVDLTVNSQLINTAVKEALKSGITVDEFLDVAQFVGIDNFMVLKPLGTQEQIQTRIDEQNDIIKRQTELKKTGAGNDTLLREARIKKAILQKVKLNKIVDNEIQKVNVEESKTPEIKQEIENAKQDVDTLTKSDTASDFSAGLDNNLTTDQKVKRLGNAVIKKIFGSDKLGFDSVMTLPEYTNARTAITNSANKIFDFAKKHRTYGIYTDLRNALNLMRTVNQSNFIEHTKTPNLDGNDVIAENAFLYHFLFSDNNTISAFIDAYLERAEASITGETLNLSKKDLVGQAFKATDNLMQIQAESAGIEYNSIYNEDGSLKDENVASVFMSYQNQFAVESTPEQLTLFQRNQANGFYDPELNTVVLGKNWNTMTLPHEFAHYWLNTLFNLYKRVQSGELQANADWVAEKRDMFAMLGIDENQQKLTTGQQERFATMVESYLTGIGVSKEIPQTFKEYFQWVPEKYKSLQQLAYLDENGKVNNVFLDQKAVDFFNRWYENASLPSLSTSPERQRYMNVSDDNGVIQRVSIKEMNDREKEFAQDAEEQYRTDQRLYNTLDENMPADIKPGADAQKVVINERSNFLKESQAEQQKITEEPKRRWFERKSRETETQLAQEYIDKNPEHAREVIFGDPELIPNDTGVDRATLINTYMAVNNITPDKPEWATLHTNIAINQSLAGTQLALSNDKSYGTYLDALREIENALELKAATNYAGSKVGAKEKFNSDIQRFLDKELPSIFATEPDSKEREVALKVMFEKARTTFSGNTTGSFLNQFDIDFAKKQTKKTDAFVRWATNQIKKDAGAKLNSDQQAHLLKISAKAQQSLEDLDSQDIPTAVAAGQDLRKWQLEKQKMMGVSPQKFSLFGDWAPRAMLASFNTLVVANVPSTAINTAVTNVLKTGLFGKNKVSDNLIKGEIKRIKAIYGATSMNLAQMEKPTSPSLLHGEKYSASGQKWYDPYTILGKEDNAFRVPTFVNTLAQIASKDAEATGRSADEVFKEYCALNNQSDSAKLARKQALAVSNMAVFTQNGALANCLNHIRSELNKLSRSIIGLDPQGFGLGNLIAPFLATGANIAEMGIRGSLAPVIQIATLVKQWRTGKKLDPIKALALRMDWAYFAISAVSMALLAALTSDDDEFYTDPYRTGIKYDPNKPYDSINLGGYWLDLDFFGPFAIPMRTAAKIIQAWKKDNGLGEAILKGYAQSGKEVLGDIPLAESIVNNQVSWAMRKPGAWASSYIYTQANKLVPAQIKSISRVISRGQGWVAEPGGTVGRKFNRNYGFDGAELTSQDLLELFTIKLQLSNERQQQLDRLFLY